jgi:hypothetical protein
MKENLQEIIKLRNQLLRASILRDNHVNLGAPLKARMSASQDNLNERASGDSDRQATFMASLSPRNNNWPPQETDSGLTSQKSNSTITSSTHSSLSSADSNKRQAISGAKKTATTVRGHSFQHRHAASSLATGLNNSAALNDLTYKSHTREEILVLLQQAQAENQILKRQSDCNE